MVQNRTMCYIEAPVRRDFSVWENKEGSQNCILNWVLKKEPNFSRGRGLGTFSAKLRSKPEEVRKSPLGIHKLYNSPTGFEEMHRKKDHS